MPILLIRDKNGKFIPIPAIRGSEGKSAYEQAQEGGYTGTEQEFIALLNGLTSTEDAAHYSDLNNPHKVTKEQVGLGNVDNTRDADKPVSTAQFEAINAHATNKSNPHEVTAKQTGAIPETYYASDDLNIEIQQGGNKMTVCSYHSGTLNTPYKEGLTVFAHGMVITNANSNQYGTQLCMPSGENAIYVRRFNGSGISKWVKMADHESVAHIASGSYKGTGIHGLNNPNSLTFEFVPKMVVVGKKGSGNATNGSTFIWISPGTTLNFINNGSTYWVYASLNDKTFSWYSTESSSYQLNNSNYEYSYLAWG